MINYDKIDDDPVVAEVRKAREDIFAEYNFDIAAYMEAMRKKESTSGHKYASPRDLAKNETPAPLLQT